MNQWISFKDKWPDQMSFVLICSVDGKEKSYASVVISNNLQGSPEINFYIDCCCGESVKFYPAYWMYVPDISPIWNNWADKKPKDGQKILVKSFDKKVCKTQERWDINEEVIRSDKDCIGCDDIFSIHRATYYESVDNKPKQYSTYAYAHVNIQTRELLIVDGVIFKQGSVCWCQWLELYV